MALQRDEHRLYLAVADLIGFVHLIKGCLDFLCFFLPKLLLKLLDLRRDPDAALVRLSTDNHTFSDFFVRR